MSQRRSEFIGLDLPANYTYLPLLSACIAEMIGQAGDLPNAEMLVYQAQLAAHELYANIVNHAYQRDDSQRIGVRLTLEWNPRSLIIEMRDRGCSFDPASVPDPDLDQVRENGYGLFLIRNLIDDVTYEVRQDENLWRLVKSF